MSGPMRLIVMAALSLGVVTPAVAEDAAVHCASMLVPLEPLAGSTVAKLEPIGCFASYDLALEVGTGTLVDVPSDVSPATLSQEAAAMLVTTSSVLIGTEFDAYGFGGGSESYFAPSTCSSSVSWSVSNVGAEWNDRFQSGKGFGGCDTNRKFEHADFSGDVRICTPNCMDYSALANEVTSLRWRN